MNLLIRLNDNAISDNTPRRRWMTVAIKAMTVSNFRIKGGCLYETVRSLRITFDYAQEDACALRADLNASQFYDIDHSQRGNAGNVS